MQHIYQVPFHQVKPGWVVYTTTQYLIYYVFSIRSGMALTYYIRLQLTMLTHVSVTVILVSCTRHIQGRFLQERYRYLWDSIVCITHYANDKHYVMKVLIRRYMRTFIVTLCGVNANYILCICLMCCAEYRHHAFSGKVQCNIILGNKSVKTSRKLCW